MKKSTAILLLMIITLLSAVPFTGACAGDDEITRYYIVTENGLTVNMRSRPEGSLITRLGVGKPVTLISDAGNGWTKISAKVDGEIVTGYVMSEFLTDEDPTELPQTFEDVRRFTVTVSPSKGEDGHINLRSGPTVESVCLRYLHKDDVLTVIAESNAWYKVRTAAGTTGYVVKAFVTK
ncbi:MAG: SH3 domain-containing protein [Clostridia bacterium]|nr:SH3 domain-containing protein [Clostridia bacterium]